MKAQFTHYYQGQVYQNSTENTTVLCDSWGRGIARAETRIPQPKAVRVADALAGVRRRGVARAETQRRRVLDGGGQTGVYPFSDFCRLSPKKRQKKCGILLTVFGKIPIAQKNQKESRTVNDTKIASKAKAQLANSIHHN